MLKFSLKYYLKCIALSIAAYICGGFILAFILTEGESVLSYILPLILTIVGIAIRIMFLNHQIKTENILNFKFSDYFKMSIPALFLLAFTGLVYLCNNYVNTIDNLLYQSIFDKMEMFVLALYPESLTVNGIIYVLSYWSDTVYYLLLIGNIVVYLLTIWIYISIRQLCKKNHKASDTE